MLIPHDDARPARLRRALDVACVLLSVKRRDGDPMPTLSLRADDFIRLYDLLEAAGVDPLVTRFP